MSTFSKLVSKYGVVSVILAAVVSVLLAVLVNAWFVMLAFGLISSGWAAVPALSYKASLGVTILAACVQAVNRSTK